MVHRRKTTDRQGCYPVRGIAPATCAYDVKWEATRQILKRDTRQQLDEYYDEREDAPIERRCTSRDECDY